MRYGLIFLTAAVISFLVSPLTIKLAPKIGAIDVPSDGRRMHSRPIPRFGGLAIFAGTEAALLIFMHGDPKVVAMVIGGVCIYAVGVYDDLRGMSAKVKFALQILCAAVLYIGGLRIEFVKNPFDVNTYIDFAPVVSVILTVLWVVAFTNTVNLIDGLDGLAAGVSSIASACICYCAVLSGQYDVGLAMLAISGGALGFLPFNFSPAKTFMGDSGSLFLGFMIAAGSVYGSTKGATLIATLVPVLVLGVPIFDTAFAIVRRWVNNYPIMGADKGHLHHRIMSTGIGQRRTVLIMYCISAVMGMVAVLIVMRVMIVALILMIVAALMICVFVADHQSLKEIMREGIPDKDNDTGRGGSK